MEIKNFFGANVIFAEGQGEYRDLPAHKKIGGDVISAWTPTKEELELLNAGHPVYLHQMTFNNPLQPVLLEVREHPPVNLYFEKKQTRRIHEGAATNNPWAAAIACLTGARDAEEVLQVDVLDASNYLELLDDYLLRRGFKRERFEKDPKLTDWAYLAYGYNPTGDANAVIMAGGEVVFDTDPLNSGIEMEPEFYEVIKPIQKREL